MKVKCRSCGKLFKPEEETCPYCGAFQNAPVRSADSTPRTVEELKAFARRHDLPLEKMRFFLGENYTGPRAYGIYQDENTGNFIVYKNKADGSRAVRYRGYDEAYAVNELYQKMKSEIENQRAHRMGWSQVDPQRRSSVTAEEELRFSTRRSSKTSAFTAAERRRDVERRFGTARSVVGRSAVSFVKAILIVSVIIMVLTCVLTIAFVTLRGESDEPTQGYYRYQDTTYYPWHGGWYYWDDVYDDWYETEPPLDFTEDYDSYYLTDSYYEIDDGRIDSFYNGSVYEDYYSESDTYSSYDSDDSYSSWDDDDWDWDDDWDSGWTDWDSDW